MVPGGLRPPTSGKVRFADLHVSHLSSGAMVSRARSRERASQQFQDVLGRTVCLSASVPALGRTRHPLAVSGLEGPSQKIELVFSASPETIRREPRESDLLRSVGKMQDLAGCGFRHPVDFGSVYAAAVLRSSAGTKFLCCRSTASRYATIFRATASVARLLFPFCLSPS